MSTRRTYTRGRYPLDIDTRAFGGRTRHNGLERELQGFGHDAGQVAHTEPHSQNPACVTAVRLVQCDCQGFLRQAQFVNSYLPLSRMDDSFGSRLSIRAISPVARPLSAKAPVGQA